MLYSGSWSAADFFRRLTYQNILAKKHNFAVAEVSGLQGFLDVISQSQSYPNIIAIDDTSEGYSELSNSPHSRMIKAVYLTMRHSPADMDARNKCLEIMHEIFRQFMSAIIREKTLLAENMIYLDSKISFSEMDKYFCTGQACAFFQLTIDTDTDMRFNPDEWIPKTTNP